MTHLWVIIYIPEDGRAVKKAFALADNMLAVLRQVELKIGDVEPISITRETGRENQQEVSELLWEREG